ncbi:SMI1/KNR4 family protein [Microbispora triticiradicis]|uniref:SMI1/KNR4 family protein n=2 Tax=Microbispora TaxID=2005 RepID=A0ABY3LSA1_9ACTN|nr:MULTISPECIES: SMI1/KNR4 family protein [Microbispora]TLP62488.1 SMI1/KNR4 family protein [Microbispora fusca]TYB52005.1 SMI1/KNR4 family protein [Microbispora tritici]
MADVDDVIRRVSAKALSVEGQLPPTAEAEELVQAEKQLGFPLPPVLARLYREVANGGFGPDYQFFPLLGEGRTAVSVYLEERSMSLSCAAAFWPAGVLPILDWGCGMYAAVDCQSSEGAVLLFDPNPIDNDDWHLAWFADSKSLINWLETWLSGRGWYEEDTDGGGDMQPWEMARARLSESS